MTFFFGPRELSRKNIKLNPMAEEYLRSFEEGHQRANPGVPIVYVHCGGCGRLHVSVGAHDEGAITITIPEGQWEESSHKSN